MTKEWTSLNERRVSEREAGRGTGMGEAGTLLKRREKENDDEDGQGDTF